MQFSRREFEKTIVAMRERERERDLKGETKYGGGKERGQEEILRKEISIYANLLG